MDEEATKAIQEAMHIFQENNTQESPPAVPIDTLPTSQEPEEEPKPEQQEMPDQEPPIVTELEREPDTSKRKKRHRLGLAVLMAGIISVTVIVMLVIAPLFHPTATITIIPSVATVSANGTVEVQGRSLTPVTTSQAKTVPATGTGHQDARAASGSITFYNGYTAAQTVPAGTLMQTASGVQIVTDADAEVSAANPPMQGQATVPAHTLETGPAGNIKAYSIYGACCRAYILAENIVAFTGGQSSRTFQAVTQSDIDHAVTPLKTSLIQSVQSALQAQLHQGEALAPSPCIPSISSDHKAGEEAVQVGVTVTDSCTGYAYQAEDVQTQATDILIAATKQQLGDGYIVIGDPRVTVTGASASGSLLRLAIKAQGAMAYQFTQAQLQAIKNHIASMDKAEAAAWIARQPGIKAVSIDVSTGATLPHNPGAIRCTLLYAA